MTKDVLFYNCQTDKKTKKYLKNEILKHENF